MTARRPEATGLTAAHRQRFVRVLHSSAIGGALLAALVMAALPAAIPSEAANATMPIQANTIVHNSGAEARILWCDATANFKRLSTREGVAQLMEHCKEANINVVVMDVKELSGRVLYDSKIAPHLTEYDGVKLTPGYDLLRAASEEAHKVGIAIYASINVFSEGRLSDGGPIFGHPEWESLTYAVEPWVHTPSGDSYPVADVDKRALPGRMALFDKAETAGPRQDGETYAALDRKTFTVLSIDAPAPPKNAVLLVAERTAGDWLSQLKTGEQLQLTAKPRMLPAHLTSEIHNAIFVNPANREVQDRELQIIHEIAANYNIDGIVLDRMRYPGLNSDFSDDSRRQFEAWQGHRVANWPADALTFGPLPSDPPIFGPLFKQWIQWRAQVIKDFFAQARAVVKSVKPQMEISSYVGSWYSSYYPLGVNWASDKFQPSASWASPGYHRTGYAPLADWISTGCYYPTATRKQAESKGTDESATVEAAAQQSVAVIGDATFTYGGVYLLDYDKNPAEFLEAIKTCEEQTQGVMLFDLVYVEDYGWWDLLKQAFPEPARIPDKDPQLRQQLRQAYEEAQ